MRKSLFNILGVSCGYAAAVIGAGFASGQEIVSFFVKYGKCSIIGICIACVIFSLFSCAVLCTCVDKKIYNYSDFLDSIFKGGHIRRIMEVMTLVFAAASLCVMTACAGEMGKVLLGVPRIAGALAFTAACGAIFFMGSKKLMEINSVLGAVIVFGIILSCLYILRFREHQAFANEVSMAVSGVVYAGYNLLTAGAILSGMSRCLKSKGEAVLSSAVSGFVLFVMITLIWGVLGIYYGKINLGEIPMLTMSLRQNNILGIFYGIMLLFAVLTTGVSNGFGVIDIAVKKISRTKAVVILLITAFCMSGAGFANLINTAYRICGYVGMVIVFAVIYKFLKNIKKVVKQRK